jgi:BASS family bile acid:Na+ symporter
LVLVPLLVGLAIRARSGSRAAQWQHLLVRSANISLTVALVAGVAANRSSLVDLGSSQVVPASIVIVAFAVGIGMLVGGRDAPTRTASGLVSGMRFAALGLITIGTQLDGRPSILGPAIIFALVAMVVALACALAIARWPSRITEPGAA